MGINKKNAAYVQYKYTLRQIAVVLEMMRTGLLATNEAKIM